MPKAGIAETTADEAKLGEARKPGDEGIEGGDCKDEITDPQDNEEVENENGGEEEGEGDEAAEI